MVQVGDWAKGNKDVDFVFQVSMTLRQRRKHLRCTLWVPNVANLIMPSLLSNEINLCRSIILSKLVEAVVVELSIVPFFVEGNMLSRVFGSSIVSKPDIIAGICYLVCCRLIFSHDPVVRAGKEPMLEEHCWSTFFHFRRPNMLYVELIPVWSNDLKALLVKSLVFCKIVEA
jgi:hypothetical protein